MTPVTTLRWHVAPMCAFGAAASTRSSAVLVSAAIAVQGTKKNRHYGRPLGLGRSTG